MSYILKNTSGLINTKLTDTGRRKLSQGNFNISYFQIGDSEVSYNVIPSFPHPNSYVLEPSFNSSNISGVPESNKQYIKYPYYVDGTSGNTYGIPFSDSVVSLIYNTAAMKGFFDGDTENIEDTPVDWKVFTSEDYVINSNYVVHISDFGCSDKVTLIYSACSEGIVRQPAAGDFITFYYNPNITDTCVCTATTTTTTTTPIITTTTTFNPCAPTTTTTTTIEPTTTTTTTEPFIPTPPVDCVMNVDSCHPMMTYRIISICNNEVTLDRPTPNLSILGGDCYVRALVYPPNMSTIYDSSVPTYNAGVIDFQSECNAGVTFTNIWNMNTPWSENPAGLNPSFYAGYTKFGSINYLGSKEYFGYSNSNGQNDTDYVYYYNSLGEIVFVEPKEQKAISIVHYTNNSPGLYYGEKFALEPFDEDNPGNTGQARNFRVHIPWIMWHKNPECCYGQTFWVDPPGFENFNLFQVYYLESNKNLDMNNPGHRYYHLWDTNANDSNERPNRVGKVFPDQKMIIFDDEEIIAAMSYKSNRNWTLPAPKLGLITPNVCGPLGDSTGILLNSDEYLYVTYRFNDDIFCLNSLHCNYYTKIQGPNIDCTNLSSQNVTLQFGPEFNCLKQPFSPYVTTTTTHEPLTTTTTLCPTSCETIDGYYANKFEILVQKVSGTGRPDSSLWKVIDFTDQLDSTMINGYITQDGLTQNTFVITKDLYDSAPLYNLNNYIPLTPANYSGTSLNFGDEYYFYGSIEADIEASIYEMRYKVNLSQTEFQTPSNPTWNVNERRFITEIGLYDNEKNLMIISKMQSPVLRQGTQQFLVKLDF
ncbi:MAG: hypothetical protein RLZ10_1511 [Bacteroidota bacterium]|jgi:hypothetical protein